VALEQKDCVGVTDTEGLCVCVWHTVAVCEGDTEREGVGVALGHMEAVAQGLGLAELLGETVELRQGLGLEVCDSVPLGQKVCVGERDGDELWLCDKVLLGQIVEVVQGVGVADCDSEPLAQWVCVSDGVVLGLMLVVRLEVELTVKEREEDEEPEGEEEKVDGIARGRMVSSRSSSRLLATRMAGPAPHLHEQTSRGRCCVTPTISPPQG
jgi:hypothetical protein